MEDSDSPWSGIDRRRLHRITDPAQADILADPVRSRFLFPFLGRDSTVAQAAAELGCGANTMLYRVRRMSAVGLLRVSEVRRRPGRPVRVYTSTHPGYFVPDSVMSYDDLRHRVARHERRLSEQLIDAYTALLRRAGHSGRALARDAQGTVWTTDLPPATDRRGAPAFTVDLDVALTAKEARQIRDLLSAAAERAISDSKQPGRGRRSYLVRCLILPTG